MPLPSGLSVTWFGHSTFLLKVPNGKRLLFDPFITGNASCPSAMKDLTALAPLDLMLISHGHTDHFLDAVTVAKETDCTVVCIFEIMEYMAGKGIQKFEPMNKGGSVKIPALGLTVTMTHAFHSNNIHGEDTTVYGGEPAGLVVTLDDGFALYFAGDTAVFSDMALITELYHPQLAFLPIGDRFTMGPKEAAKAVELLSTVDTVIPMHYGTFPMLTGTPDALKTELSNRNVSVKVLTPAPGETLTF